MPDFMTSTSLTPFAEWQPVPVVTSTFEVDQETDMSPELIVERCLESLLSSPPSESRAWIEESGLPPMPRPDVDVGLRMLSRMQLRW